MSSTARSGAVRPGSGCRARARSRSSLTDKLYVVHGTLRRRAAGVRLSRAGAIEIEQTLLGRLLGYGTLIAANLEIDYVPDPQEVWHLVGGTRAEEIVLPPREREHEHEHEPRRRPLRVSPHARRRTA